MNVNFEEINRTLCYFKAVQPTSKEKTHSFIQLICKYFAFASVDAFSVSCFRKMNYEGILEQWMQILVAQYLDTYLVILSCKSWCHHCNNVMPYIDMHFPDTLTNYFGLGYCSWQTWRIFLVFFLLLVGNVKRKPNWLMNLINYIIAILRPITDYSSYILIC